MVILGLDSSTSITGWAFSENGNILDAGFINTSKVETNRERGQLIIKTLNENQFIKKTHHINLEAALSGFGGGLTSQQTIIILSRWNAILEFMLQDEYSIPVILCNVNTMRKKVFGKARIAGIKPKEYVKAQIPFACPNVKTFEKLNRNGDWDAHNSDMYDAIVCSLYG
jgi:hypothetical protein